MDIAIIVTYRCSSRCSMCNVWKNPSLPSEEISLEAMTKIPNNVGTIGLTGGEPTLRTDLAEIVDLLYPKTSKFEISSNGVFPERIYPIIQKYPDIKIRFSLEGFQDTNNLIRGEKDGFHKKERGLLHLQELGGKDLGFAITIQDGNADELVKLFEYTEAHCFELATSTLHNGFQFHKVDNVIYDRLRTARCIEDLITSQLKTSSVKNWFRAYLNLGIVARVLGHDRILPCTAGTDFLFIDPWGDVFACNIRPDLKLGNLIEQSWDEIINGYMSKEILMKVKDCKHNCWMAGDAKTAMRLRRFPKLPKWTPVYWVLENKIRIALGGEINFNRYIDHSIGCQNPRMDHREYLPTSRTIERRVKRKDENHYMHPDAYKNH